MPSLINVLAPAAGAVIGVLLFNKFLSKKLFTKVVSGRNFVSANAHTKAQALEMVPAADKCLVYVYRETAEWGDAVGMNFAVDGNIFGRLVCGQFAICEVPPGAHLLSATYDRRKKPLTEIALVAQAGDVVVYRFAWEKSGLKATPRGQQIGDLAAARTAIGAMEMIVPDPAAKA